MKIMPSALDPEETYKLMTGVVVPRPIAWVTSLSEDGVLNLAPFSCFTFVSSKPPMVGINIGRKAGVRKDTGHNIHRGGEFVVNIPDETMIEAVHHSAVEYPSGVSEVETLGLDTVDSDRVGVARLRDVPVSLECRLHGVTAYGLTGAEFVVGEILAFHVRDSLMADGKVDTAAMRPIARIAGPNYAALGEITSMRPIGRTPKTVLVDGDGR
ncbi:MULTISPECIES: flavin reductase family protein [Streptomyces]|uniref:flavin reductase family protein n=1 Tax=Streptomyces lycopersici TaxID=2974589 RepID=UPI0021CF0FA7|nr:flavin reductase family protein [Streptomyces sp. NEAU-383]